MVQRKRIGIIGAGAAGCACAWSLSRYDNYEIHVIDKESVPGGAAISTQFDISRNQFRINDGVQGCAPSYRNTIRLFQHASESRMHPLKLRISFGRDETHWSNYKVFPFVESQEKEINRFGRFLWLVSALEPIFLMVPIKTSLKWMRFSREFGDSMVYPLAALFFGTGNQTPNVSTAIIARVFLDPDLKLFDFDERYFLSQEPDMMAFPMLQDVYSKLLSEDGRSEKIHTHFNSKVVSVTRGCVCQDDKAKTVTKVLLETGQEIKALEFDEVVMACGADVARVVLKDMNFWESLILNKVKYFDDLIVTHHDIEYMESMYSLPYKQMVHDNIHYLVRSDPVNKEIIEMSFILSNYQSQVSKHEPPIFQTIFLDKQLEKTWTLNQINEDKIFGMRWWHQFAHTWTHFAWIPPLVRFLRNPSTHTWFAGSYTLFNTHEIAIISGLAVAHELGADYPFADDVLATKQFDMYLELIMGNRRRGKEGRFSWCSIPGMLKFFQAVASYLIA